MNLSIIIPVLDEAAIIAGTVMRARATGAAEIIVVDGGSKDATAGNAAKAGARVIASAPGRARQQNAGAAAAAGDALLFLHADTALPGNALERVQRVLGDPAVALGAFRLGYDRDDWGTRFLVFGADLRMRLFRLPYGDQALFLRRETFRSLGGFRDLPAMEDLCLVTRAKRSGRVVVAPERVRTSPRAYDRVGLFRIMLRNWRDAGLFSLGLRPPPPA
ncbi:MAG: TIGR04283 family arsenosugar biosynthesis glycosyltransferase [Deltaproteobacteria bacterium]|nr:TIGR04283 family arsenosugar biosynthesis glycosyltransferase [Deltaproteobacteria bacterium]